MPDMVNHPSHYISETGLETIDVIEAFTFDLKGIEATDTGNIIKYISRWKHKNGLEDLKKAQWYLNHLIDHVEKIKKENTNEKIEKYGLRNVCLRDGIILENGAEADAVLSRMQDIINTYGFASVADLYDLVGITGEYTDNKYGWTNIDNAITIHTLNDKCKLYMSKPIRLSYPE